MIVSSGGGDLQLIEGALDGLHGLLFHFHSIPDIDEEGRADIHKYVRMALDPQIKLSRYGVPMGNFFCFLLYSFILLLLHL